MSPMLVPKTSYTGSAYPSGIPSSFAARRTAAMIASSVLTSVPPRSVTTRSIFRPFSLTLHFREKYDNCSGVLHILGSRRRFRREFDRSLSMHARWQCEFLSGPQCGLLRSNSSRSMTNSFTRTLLNDEPTRTLCRSLSTSAHRMMSTRRSYLIILEPVSHFMHKSCTNQYLSRARP